MAEMKISTNNLYNLVLPKVYSCRQTLEETKNLIYKSINVDMPTNFAYQSLLRSMPNNIEYMIDDIIKIDNWIHDVIHKMYNAEKNNIDILGDIRSSKYNYENYVKKNETNYADDISKLCAANLSSGIESAIKFILPKHNKSTGTKKTKKHTTKHKSFLEKVSDGAASLAGGVADIASDGLDCVTSFADDAVEWVTDTSAYKAVDGFVSDRVDDVTELADGAAKGLKKTGAKLSKGAKSFLGSAGEFTKATAASTGNTIMAALKGVGNLGEGLLDFSILTDTGAGALCTLQVDAFNYIKYWSSGKKGDYKSLTSEMWKSAMSYVSEEQVEGLYKSFYKKTAVGKWLDKESISTLKSDGTAYNVVGGISNVAALAVLSFFTGGAVGAVTAGTSAAGKAVEGQWVESKQNSWVGIQEEYKKGNISKETYEKYLEIRNMSNEEWNQVINEHDSGNISDEEFSELKNIREMESDWKNLKNATTGLGIGIADGVFDGASWFLGGKIAGLGGASSKLSTKALRVGADTLISAAGTPYETLTESLIKGKDIKQVWNEKGRWTAFATNALVGAGLSTVGEVSGAAGKFAERYKNNISKVELNKNVKEVLKQNKNNLVKSVKKEIPKKVDDLTKARIAYIKLNSAVSYSDEYFARNSLKNMNAYEFDEIANKTNSEILSDIYYKKVDISNMDVSDNSIVCNTWAQMYADLLSELGFDSSKIKILGSDGFGKHKFVSVELEDGKVLLADATENIGGYIDISNSKLNKSTSGFVITTEEEINKLKEQLGGTKWKYIIKMINEKEDNKKALSEIDKKIGYNTETGKLDYDDILKYYSKGTEDTINIEDKVKIFKNIFDNNFGAIESYPVMRNYSKKIFGNNAFSILYVKDGDTINVVQINSNSGNKTYLYKINNGEIIESNNIENIIKGAKMITNG